MVRRINAFNIPQYQRSLGKQAACCFQGKTFGVAFAHFLDHCVGFRQHTPATKAPIAIERPPISISSAAPNTTSNAAAVMTSRALARANT